jgi:sugar O-acyltransferase (sialic acid O-acetyltransferase NeuD family)
MMKDIILIGGGGHCKSVIDVIEQEGRFTIVGIVDKPELLGTNVLNYQVIGNDSDLSDLAKKYKYAIVTAGQIKSPLLRIKLFELALNAKFTLPNILSPRSYVSRHAYVGKGSVVMHNALVNANTRIGCNCIINTNALVEHDSDVADHCHIATNAVINGSTSVGQGSFIGSGSTTKEGVAISENRFIKAGSVIK